MISRIQINSQDIKCENLGDIEFNYAQSSEAACFQVVEEMKTKLLFIGSAYDEIVAYTTDICASNTLDIYEMCDGVESLVFTGLFTLTSCEFNYDLCSVEVEIEPNSKYNCLLKSIGNEINILKESLPIAYDYSESFNFELKIVKPTDPDDTTYNNIATITTGFIDDPVALVYARIQEVTSCLAGLPQEPQPVTYPVPSPWTLLSNDCALSNTSTYTRPAVLQFDTPNNFPTTIAWSDGVYSPNQTGIPLPPPTSMVDPVLLGITFVTPSEASTAVPSGEYTFYLPQLDFQIEPIRIENGRYLSRVIRFMLDEIGCGLTFKSDFFGFSPLANYPNAVTGFDPSPTLGLLLFQKSDIANPTATEKATIANISLEALLSDLNVMFNTWWQVNENTNELVVEHWSTLNNLSTGIDLTVDPYRQYSRNNNTVTYLKEDQPSLEQFGYAVNTSDVDFSGLNITYNPDCSATPVLKRQTQQICVDFRQVLNNPDFETEGLMLIQIQSLEVSGAKAQNGRVTGVFNPNAPLGYGATLPDYYTYNRPNKEGTINNTLTVFDSTKRLKSLKEVTIPFCCSISDANVFINTFQGEGVIEEATYTPSKQILTIKTILEL